MTRGMRWRRRRWRRSACLSGIEEGTGDGGGALFLGGGGGGGGRKEEQGRFGGRSFQTRTHRTPHTNDRETRAPVGGGGGDARKAPRRAQARARPSAGFKGAAGCRRSSVHGFAADSPWFENRASQILSIVVR